MKFREECWEILAWLLDQTDGSLEPRLGITCNSDTDPTILLSALAYNETGYREQAAKAFPREQVLRFCNWMFMMMGTGHAAGGKNTT